ncbi:MAG: isoleucine--tRNA ligase [Alphaproteobacteria bacterium]|nr:isoleucine--tRNA ligase [Alphaproteobacteria bacterium]HCP01322.1 isoleucine--tRNA ligase [Rhodospirillaceae bacterium]
MAIDYKDTVFLPKTDFPMRAGLPKKEPELLAYWADLELFSRQRAESAGRPPFVLHDGPPYANGHLHIGHALNKILKDVISRSQQMMGKDSNYVPGWDCHGLPIEWKIEEQYRADGQNKDDVPILEFRNECREFAAKWIDIQSEEFQRLGVIGNWHDPYTTMAYGAEAQIAREIAKFAMNGGLYRGARPVLWSVVEKTALADAEVEYEDHVSPSIYVRFPVVSGADRALDGAAIVIWTTTPWTIPGNRAIAVGAELDYVRIRVEVVNEKSRVQVGDELVIAKALRESACQEMGIEGSEDVALLRGEDIVGSVCVHPLHAKGFDHEVPVFAGDFVTIDQGTGFVHIAPSHGEDDFHLGRAHDLSVPDMVNEVGCYFEHVPLFAGMAVLTPDGDEGEANGAVMSVLEGENALLGRRRLEHSYPHSWRSKAPLIFRNTSQWFISMKTNDLRDKALTAISETRFVPSQGQTRLRSMIETRPDWCISRQRAWGVPIPIFVHKQTGELLRDQAVFDRIAEAFAAEGGDSWFASPPSRFLGNDYDAEEYEQVRDIVDVWFDSGSTHAFVLEDRDDLQWPASLYLEGSDQHRGWFHSSLLESCGTRGRAPYDAVLTHGFVMAEDGRKMSKSRGTDVSPQETVESLGADILRIWVVSSDYSEDLRLGPEILKHQSDLYRRIRNTLRFLLGNLDGFEDSERVPVVEMPELERWVLHRIHAMDALVRQTTDDFEFHTQWTALHNFCAVELSAFYFDIRKDALYCDSVDSVRRRAARTVLDALFSYLTAWLAPILCFTAEEAWLARRSGSDVDSVHLRTFPDVPNTWRDDALANKWEKVRNLRRVVTGALEIERAEKRIGSSLQAAPTVYVDGETAAAMTGLDLAEICITSGGTLVEAAPPDSAFRLSDVEALAVEPALAEGEKCARCWQVLPDVGASDYPDVCGRCAAAINGRQGSAD